jgi:hypothetical protein
MVARLISLRAFKYLIAIFAGALLSFAGVLFHNSLEPFGLLLALVIAFAGVRAIGHLAQSQLAMWFSLLGWFFVLMVASKQGVSFEQLIVGNINGNLYSVGGVVLVIVAACFKVK